MPKIQDSKKRMAVEEPAVKEELIPEAHEEPADLSVANADMPEGEEAAFFSAEGEEKLDAKGKKSDRYFEAVGRRKTAVARVRLFTKAGEFTVNDKLYSVYFPTLALQKITEDALKKMKLFGRFRISVHASGGGLHSQAEAVRHGLSRCLIKFNPDFRKRLKRVGFLKRDPRAKERKKFGLKKARRAPQWQKR